MNVKFKPTTPSIEMEENIIVDGKTIGSVKTYTCEDKTRYHARFSFKPTGYSINSIHGFGHTKEEAILNAMKV